MNKLDEWMNTVQCMDWLKGMGQLPDGCIHCVVTSPPYFGLRCYGVEGQLGLEKTPEEYIEKLVIGFRELKRIMHPTGTVSLNLGDSYVGGKMTKDNGKEGGHWSNRNGRLDRQVAGLKPKDLMEMPSRVVLALQADGWWLRSRIPWLKRNAMPESTDDRPTQAVEYVFLLTKSGTPQFWTHRRKWGTDQKPKPDYIYTHKGTELITDYQPVTNRILKEFWKRSNLWRGHDYFYDGEAVRVKQIGDFPPDKFGVLSESNKFSSIEGNRSKKFGTKWSPTKRSYHPSGRSRRNSDWFFESWQGLWTDENGDPLAFIVNPKAFKGAHFATFPPGLVIPCIKAGTSEKGCCPECGNPWVRVISKKKSFESASGRSGNPISGKHPEGCQGGGDTGDVRKGPVVESQTLGWRPTCSCGKEPIPCRVFDPFAGTGTVIEVARRMGRNGLGFDINPQYVNDFARERLAQEILEI